jgi:phosphatidylcholine synthase
MPVLVHLLTASGAVVGLWGLQAAAEGRFRDAFFAMIAATVVDGVDGWLARRVDVARRVPGIDGARLDDIVDYGTFVVLPAFVALRLGLVPAGWGWPTAAAMLIASAYGFARTDAKTASAFTGFPSYWNVVVFYLAAAGLAAFANAAVLLACAALVFVRVRFVYPTKTSMLRATTLTLMAAWGVLLSWLVWRYPDVPRTWLAISCAFPLYYLGLSIVVHPRRTTRAR